MEVEKTVGQAKVEEELERQVIIRLSGGAVNPLSSGYTPLFSGIKLSLFLCHTVSLLYEFPLFLKADPLDQTSAYQIFQPDPLVHLGLSHLQMSHQKGRRPELQ